MQGAKRNGRYSGICGQAPSDFPEIAEFLVKERIDSISLNPESTVKITLKVVETEKEYGDSEPSGESADMLLVRSAGFSSHECQRWFTNCCLRISVYLYGI